MLRSLVGSEMCIRDRSTGTVSLTMSAGQDAVTEPVVEQENPAAPVEEDVDTELNQMRQRLLGLMDQRAERQRNNRHAGVLEPHGTIYRRGNVYGTKTADRPIELFRPTIRYRPGFVAGAERNPNFKVAALTGSELEMIVRPHALDLMKVLDQLLNDEPIEEVDLSDRCIGNPEVDKLCAALALHETVKSLKLDSNEITDVGVEKLAAALTRNQSIISLDLAHNRIGTQGLEALLMMLGGVDGLSKPRNLTLREINLDGNPAFDSSPADELWRQDQIVANVALKERINTLLSLSLIHI
eukprot:TRINITY_DN17249_c0_g1_i2.p1 TRINITY_DN17249_c0_g1~~TRINITY_DN17249_c0_g1_i2.p1  ORF type:complete len:346 (+),score=92.21 TRINITY_DN17249_c0_g1_i2:145-1038(+)